MPRKGENIRKRNDGRWEGRYAVHDGTKMVYHSVYAPNYNEVKEKLRLARSGIQQKRKSDIAVSEEISLDSVVREWLEQVKQERKASTYEKYRNSYEKYLKEVLGREKICSITSELVAQNLSTGFSESVYKSLYCILNQVLDYGAMHYRIPRMKLQRTIHNNRNILVEILDHSEQAKLMQVLCSETDASKLGILLCLFTGLRLGEICALKWEDIDMHLKVLRVNSTVQRLVVEGEPRRTKLLESSPKSNCSKREIPLSDSLFALVKGYHNGLKYVVGGSKPMDPRTYQNRFKNYLKQAGIENKKFHILRHTFATNCISNGGDVKSVSEMLGHADVKITLNRYVHPSMDTKRKNIETLAVIWGQNLGQLSKET